MSAERYQVVCDDYRCGYYSREAAELLLARIERAGMCKLPHRVELAK